MLVRHRIGRLRHYLCAPRGSRSHHLRIKSRKQAYYLVTTCPLTCRFVRLVYQRVPFCRAGSGLFIGRNIGWFRGPSRRIRDRHGSTAGSQSAITPWPVDAVWPRTAANVHGAGIRRRWTSAVAPIRCVQYRGPSVGREGGMFPRPPTLKRSVEAGTPARSAAAQPKTQPVRRGARRGRGRFRSAS